MDRVIVGVARIEADIRSDHGTIYLTLEAVTLDARRAAETSPVELLHQALGTLGHNFSTQRERRLEAEIARLHAALQEATAA